MTVTVEQMTAALRIRRVEQRFSAYVVTVSLVGESASRAATGRASTNVKCSLGFRKWYRPSMPRILLPGNGFALPE